jgi:Integrase zinc binding domain
VVINVTTRQRAQQASHAAPTTSEPALDLQEPEPAEALTPKSGLEPLSESELRVLEIPLQIEALIKEAYKTDPVPSSILQALKDGAERHPDITLAKCEERGTYLYYRDCLYVPDHDKLKAELLRACYDTPATGHPGRLKTYELLTREYYWPGIYKYVERWVRNCHTCRRSTSSREARQGVLKPLPILERSWQDISMDFITHLEPSQGYNVIFVVIDRLIKMKHFIPY